MEKQNGTATGNQEEKAENIIREMKRFQQEEEEEEKEIWESFRRLAYMLENCPGDDKAICRLVEEQQDRLNVLCIRKREFLESVKR